MAVTLRWVGVEVWGEWVGCEGGLGLVAGLRKARYFPVSLMVAMISSMAA